MVNYRHQLPQLSQDGIFITDGGLETVLIFQQGWVLPDFAAFTLLDRPLGEETLRNYFSVYGQLAQNHSVGLILDSPTWRASTDWGIRQGYSTADLDSVNRRAIALLQDVRTAYATASTPIVVSGCIGPRDDGYSPGSRMSAREAEQYHQPQIDSLRRADLVSAFTLTYPEEAIGIARAAKIAQIPVVISFTVETNGTLPNGMELQDAISMVDAATDSTPVYYMINCAHPIHFDQVILNQDTWVERIRGIRANASMMSHAELDESETLDDGNPQDLGERFYGLRQRLPHLNILGGCCGTDQRHIEAICAACGPVVAS
ncbi:MAG: homocysteine S-methyltransferase family protein [Cyanobacteria bacterium P01_D01_bin.2]